MPDFSISQLGANTPLCPNARSFGLIIEQVVFAHLSAESTPAEYHHAQTLLLAMCERFAANVAWNHFPVAVGMHRCISNVYEDASARIACLAALRKPPTPEPMPQPPEPPAPEPQGQSLEAVVETFETTGELNLADTRDGSTRH